METNSSFLQQDYDYNETILTALGNILSYYTEKHGKVLVVRFDIRYPHNYEQEISNKDISRCISKIVQKYRRQGCSPCYFWVREQESSKNQHYHCIILLNGSKVRAFNHVFTCAESLWSSTIGIENASGLIHHCTQGKDGCHHENGILLRRCDDNYHSRLHEVQQQISYIAKSEGKGTKKDGLRDFGSSRIPQSRQ